MTKQSMISRRPTSKDTVSDRNSNICISLIFEKKFYAEVNFRESRFWGVKKGIYFREFGQNSRNSRNFLPEKIISLKVNQ